jgi:TetR/AcrR family transcriptional regulator, ethionamide resistance regulator
MAVAARKEGNGDWERRRADIRDRLLAAIEILTVGGEMYSNVTIERLATQAGLSRATFYIYFASKGDLLRAWFSEALAELEQACRGWREIAAGSSRAEFTGALKTIIDTHRRRAALIAAINEEATQDSSLRDELAAVIQRATGALRAQLEKGQRDGWVDPVLLPAETATWSIWLLERGLSHVVSPATDEQVATLTETLADIAWHTLRTPG